MLVEMWQKILDRERIGINENFFALGGHSLKAIQLVSLLEKENIEINVGDIFRYSNIKSLAKNIIQPRIRNKTNLDIKYK